MGTMNRLRQNTGIILWILVGAFGIIWTLQDSGALDQVGRQQRTGNIIVVDGDPISSEEFGRRISQQVQFAERRGQQVTPQVRSQISDQVFDQLVSQRLAEREMNRLGITVTDEEVAEMALGAQPAPIVQQIVRSMVPPAQLPEDGQVDREFVQYLLSTPELKPVADQLEQTLRQQIRGQKLTALLNATVHVSDEDVADAYRRQNLKVDTRYVALPYAQVPDSAVSVSDADLQDFYDAHREDYKRAKTYRVEYVTRSKAATQKDTTAIAGDLEDLRAGFAATDDDSLFLARNGSERSFSSSYQSAPALDASVADAVFPNPSAGKIVGPVFTAGQAHLVKITGVQPADEAFVHARHILIQGDGEAARQQAQQIKQRLTSGNAGFAVMAREHSDDQSNAAQGGDLGWFGRGQMADAFEEAAFDATPGTVVGPVKTRFGYHLIKVEARANQKVQIADFALSLRPSVATLGDTEDSMRDVAVFAQEEGNFGEQAQRKDLPIRTAEVTDEDLSIPALGPSQDAKAFLQDAEAGAISDVIELDDQFAVLHVERVTPEGYRSLEDARSDVRSRALQQKKQARQQRHLTQALDESGGNLSRLAQAVGTTVRTKAGVNFTTRTLPALGNDPAFVGTALGLQQGQTSRVVTGENGAFVVTATSVQEPPELTDAKRKQLRQQLLQQRQRQVSQQWISALREDATIEDNRAQYR